MLETILITNQPELACMAVDCGVKRIMVDLEILGKKERQGHKDTLISDHTIGDIKAVRNVVPNATLMVRINPLNPNSQVEIDQAIHNGADVIMLPIFTKVEEVKAIADMIKGRAGFMPLVETPQALETIDDICNVSHITEIYLGLNDLSLAMQLRFMFEPLSMGLVDRFANAAKRHALPFGFGGIAALGSGMLPAEHIVGEHARLGSTRVILSRAFQKIISGEKNILECTSDFAHAHDAILKCYAQAMNRTPQQIEDDRKTTQALIERLARPSA